ncbi:MAG: hypothetical protein ABI566_09365 [Pseudolysinimonas sp.]
MDDAEVRAAHDAGLPHPPHPAPLDDDPPRREPTDAERLWELRDRGYLDDATYAAELEKLT